MPAISSSPTHAPVSDTGILEVLERMPDPRARRGVRHQLAAILSVTLAAVCAGARSFTAIAEWVHDTPTEALGKLGVEGQPPSESTIRRTLARLDAAVLDQVIGVWAWLRTSMIEGCRVIAVEGKTLRGAKDVAGHLTHLLAALDHGSGVVLGQVEVGAKTNEIPLIVDPLAPLDLTDVVVTADALHCQRATAEHIVGRGGHYVFTVKNNQRALRNLLKALPWKKNSRLVVDHRIRSRTTGATHDQGHRSRCRPRLPARHASSAGPPHRHPQRPQDRGGRLPDHLDADDIYAP